jgi:hypothetical protein
MGLRNWQETTVAILSEKTGPAAALLVEDALRKMKFSGPDMPAAQFLRFLRALNEELPRDIDRNATCNAIRDTVFRENGFTARG